MINDDKAATISNAATFLFWNRTKFNPADVQRNIRVVRINQQDISRKAANKQKAERRENDGQRGQISFFDTIIQNRMKRERGQKWEKN